MASLFLLLLGGFPRPRRIHVSVSPAQLFGVGTGIA